MTPWREHIPLAKFSGWSGLQNWSGNFVEIALEQRNWCKVDPNTSRLPTEASRQYPQRINDPKRDEWFYLKSIFLKVFLCEMGNTVRCWPRYWPDRPHRGRGGARLARLPWSHQLRPLGVSDQELRLDKFNFQWVLSILRCRERGSNLNFLLISEFPLTKSCSLSPPRLAGEVGCRAGWAGEAATDTASTVLNPTWNVCCNKYQVKWNTSSKIVICTMPAFHPFGFPLPDLTGLDKLRLEYSCHNTSVRNKNEMLTTQCLARNC